VPTIIYCIIEVSLPMTFYTHRAWEAFVFASKNVPRRSKFYPNINSMVNDVGDLCYNTNNAILKKVYWKTDKLGFRNDTFVEDPDVLFMGDSFFAGSGLSQDEIISNKVREAFDDKIEVYNLSPSTFTELDKLINLGILKKPKLIIFSIVERYVPNPIIIHDLKNHSQFKNTIKQILEFNNFNVYLDKVLRFYSISWIRARVFGSKGNGVPSTINKDMFFLKGLNQKNEENDAAKTVEIIITYKKYCDSINIAFLFVPMPDKESVYYDFVPFEQQSNYLFRLDSLLNNANVPTINTLKIYNDYRINNTNMLYQLDDTHWNSNATELIAKQIKVKIEQIGVFN
jgi:hypothetical protein